MQIDLERMREFSWRVVSEVPGWPDAPLRARLRRIIPLALPCMLALGMVGWNYGFREHQMKVLRVAHADLLDLEDEIAALRLSWSEQTAGELAAMAENAGSRLVQSPEEARDVLRQIKSDITAAGWQATFQVYDPINESESTQNRFRFTPAVARLESLPDTAAPFPALLTVLETFSSFPKRIDVTRLAVRVNDQRRPEVELNLRIATSLAHETLAQ